VEGPVAVVRVIPFRSCGSLRRGGELHLLTEGLVELAAEASMHPHPAPARFIGRREMEAGPTVELKT